MISSARATRAARALPIAVALALVGACGTTTGSSAGSTAAASTTAEDTSAAVVTTDDAATHEDPADLVWDEADEVAVTLDGGTASADSSAVVVDGSTVTITAAGTYRLSGELTDGQVVVQTTDEGVVRLILDGVQVTSSTSAPLVVTEAERVLLYLADGSTNALADADTYVYPDGTDEPDAALFSTADLTIAGSGSLTVTGNASDGIASKDGLVVLGGTITVDAADDGLRGKDYLVVRDGDVTVTADGDGLKATNADDASLGWVQVDGGRVSVEAGDDGVDAVTGVQVVGGILGVHAEDDGLHADGAIDLSGGEVSLAAGDDGAHADAALTVSGGTVTVTDSYEGLESAVITLSGGAVDVTASDDGINASSGSTTDQTTDQTAGQAGGPGGGAAGGPGGGGFADDGSWLYLTGGTVVVTSGGDGIDSNGSIEMTGGTVVVSGPTADNNGATDFNGTFTISGGTLVAVGSAGMVEAPDDGTQAVLNVRFGSAQAAGTLAQVVTPDGDVVATFASPTTFASVLLSTPELVAGTSYSVYVGGTQTGSVVGYYSPDGDLTGATDLGEVAAG